MSKKVVGKLGFALRVGASTWFAFVLVAVVLCWVVPREGGFGYDYEEGRPWRYGSLIASYDFPIYKSAEEVSAERAAVLEGFQPFYTRSGLTASECVASGRELLGEDVLVGSSYWEHVERLLKGVYAKGVIDSEEMGELAKEGVSGIRIVEGSEAVSCDLAGIYSTRSAYEYILNADTVQFSRVVLARMGINRWLRANLVADTVKTNAAREDLLASVSVASGMVLSGQKIVDQGEIISSELYRILQSFEQESALRNEGTETMRTEILGQVVFVVFILGLLLTYVKLFRRDYLDSPHTVWLLLVVVGLFPLISYLMVDYKFFSVYMVPYAMVAIFVRIFLDSRTAFMAMVCSTLLSSLPLQSGYEFVLLELVAGMAAIWALKDLTERSQLLRVAVIVVVACWILMFGYDLSQGIDVAHMNRSTYIYIGINGVLLLFAYPLLYLIEKLFGFTSGVTLLELSNTNNPILRRMSKVAQGTFVHSLQVANLAGEVAAKIGAKSVLVRTGALYHDVGKMLNPAFFTENQSGVNPHNELSEERSAAIIISHVTEGLRLAEKYHLPKVIKDFIVTHHGRSNTKYFYIQWKNKHPEKEPPSDMFAYPGPNPFTREQAIVMMCDAVEATSRSLKDYSEENLRAVVNRIVDGQVSEGVFKECPITFKDIADAKEVLVESLKTIYHTRISYPDLNVSKPREEVSSGLGGYFFGGGKHR